MTRFQPTPPLTKEIINASYFTAVNRCFRTFPELLECLNNFLIEEEEDILPLTNDELMNAIIEMDKESREDDDEDYEYPLNRFTINGIFHVEIHRASIKYIDTHFVVHNKVLSSTRAVAAYLGAKESTIYTKINRLGGLDAISRFTHHGVTVNIVKTIV